MDFFQNNRKISLILHQEKKNLKFLIKIATNFVPRKHLVRTFFLFFKKFIRNPGNLVTCSIGRLIPGSHFFFIYLFIYGKGFQMTRSYPSQDGGREKNKIATHQNQTGERSIVGQPTTMNESWSSWLNQLELLWGQGKQQQHQQQVA